MLFDPERHEPLLEARWDEERVREAIAEIVRDTEAHFDAEHVRWPTHPLDDDGARKEWPDLYFGAAGVIFALDLLERARLAKLQRSYASCLPVLGERAESELATFLPGHPPAYLLGDLGVRLVQWKLDPDAARADALFEWIRSAPRRPTLESGRRAGAAALSFP